MTWQFTLTGLLIGALVGLTGMGGGSLMTPILILFFGFQPTLAVGTDILHGAVFKSFGAVRHRKLGTVHARITFWMFLASAPMSLLGVEVATWIENKYGSGVGDAMAVDEVADPRDPEQRGRVEDAETSTSARWAGSCSARSRASCSRAS